MHKLPEGEFSSGEITDHFGMAKNTIYSWEELGIIPPVPRDSRGHRQYDHSHVRAIESRMSGDYRFRDTIEALCGLPEEPAVLAQMEQALQLFSVHKIETGQPIGYAELNERQALDPATVSRLLGFASLPTTDMATIAHVVDVLYAHLEAR